MITISAFKWVPDFAQGQVRDLRARWALEEAGLTKGGIEPERLGVVLGSEMLFGDIEELREGDGIGASGNADDDSIALVQRWIESLGASTATPARPSPRRRTRHDRSGT